MQLDLCIRSSGEIWVEDTYLGVTCIQMIIKATGMAKIF